MDLEEQVEGFQGTVALVASVAAAAMTLALHLTT